MKLRAVRTFWDGYVDGERGREQRYPSKQIHTDLIWREIDRCVGQENYLHVLDAGAGFGRFSIPLAVRGHRVTHLDKAPKMVAFAQKEAGSRNLANMKFVEGTIEDLSAFGDDAFDIVLCLDSPLSFCPDTYTMALSELVRVAKTKIILCVMNRLGVIFEDGCGFDLMHYGYLKTIVDVYETGTLRVTDEMRKLQPGILPSWHAFRPEELITLLESHHCHVERMSAPGSLARFVNPALLPRPKDKKAYQQYLDFEEKIDADPSVLGVGGANAGGLLVTASKLR